MTPAERVNQSSGSAAHTVPFLLSRQAPLRVLPGDAGWIMLPCYVIVQWTLVGLTMGLIFVKRSNRKRHVSPPQTDKDLKTA